MYVLQLWCVSAQANHTQHVPGIMQVFFVEDKAMPGWSVVLKKETRSRRMTCMEEELGLGQEGSRDDLQVLANMELQRSAARVDDAVTGESVPERNGRRRNWNEA